MACLSLLSLNPVSRLEDVDDDRYPEIFGQLGDEAFAQQEDSYDVEL